LARVGILFIGEVIMFRRSIGILVVAGAMLAGCSSPRSVKAAVKAEKDRNHAPDFSVKDASGASFHLSDYKGKVVLLNFWATWCGPCQIEIPWFMDFENTYKDRNFAVLGVSFDDDGWTSVKPFIEKKKLNYRIAIGTEEISTLYGGLDSLPTTFILDRQGRIAATHVGLVSKSDYQNDILKLLDDKGKDGITVEKHATNFNRGALGLFWIPGASAN
jgi:peroxiredoxin